ncbi:CobW C-terminal domain-containing protein [Stigmatella hybrida]|uniref:GTP-binding protein n=1 Tax=Stigmatella hybrida TaxID=394097 RepID=UPI00295E3FCC|nr:GTP-binding protein [Stigmatella hybrida]
MFLQYSYGIFLLEPCSPRALPRGGEAGGTVQRLHPQPGAFPPQRFWNFIHGSWKGVLRSKGFFWLATRLEACLLSSNEQAGGPEAWARFQEPLPLWEVVGTPGSDASSEPPR